MTKLDRLSKSTAIVADLPPIPQEKRYFSISEVSYLCDLKPHVLRYWEQEFKQLNPMKAANKQRYYKRDDIVLVRRIKYLLYEEGYTIEGARPRLTEHKREKSNQATFIKGLLADLKEVVKFLEAE